MNSTYHYWMAATLETEAQGSLFVCVLASYYVGRSKKLKIINCSIKLISRGLTRFVIVVKPWSSSQQQATFGSYLDAAHFKLSKYTSPWPSLILSSHLALHLPSDFFPWCLNLKCVSLLFPSINYTLYPFILDNSDTFNNRRQTLQIIRPHFM